MVNPPKRRGVQGNNINAVTIREFNYLVELTGRHPAPWFKFIKIMFTVNQ